MIFSTDCEGEVLTPLAEGVWWVRLRGAEPGGVNAYLVDDRGTLTLVDAGMPWDAPRLEEGLACIGATVSDVDRVLVTHYDLDHVGGLIRLSDLDAPIYAGYPDSGFLSGTVRPPLWNHKGAFHRVLSQFVSVESPVRTVADGDRIGGFVAYHTPGHNPGHMVYLHESLGVGALGDLVRTKADALLPPFWFDSYDLDALRTSIRELVERAPAFEFACPGHGKPLLAGNEALHELASQI